MNNIVELIDIRDALFDEIYEYAQKDKNIFFLTADMGAFSLTKFAKDLPEQFINVGISEQNMINIAAGLTLAGKKVFAYAIAPFITERCFEQVKINLGIMSLPIVLIGAGPGMTYSQDGPTHHALEDVAVIRSIPGITIFNPCDQLTAKYTAEYALVNNQPIYIRIDKGKNKVLYNNILPIEPTNVLQNGDAIALITTGVMTHKAFEIAYILQENGINPRIIDVNMIKPFDGSFKRHLNNINVLVTIEEHASAGGIGSAVGEYCSDNNILIPLLRIGIQDEYGKTYGDRDYMHACLGIDVDTICDKIKNWYSKINNSALDKGGYTENIGIEDFAAIFGVEIDELDESTKKIIEESDFEYRIVDGQEKEFLILRATSALFEDLKVSGAHRIVDWEKGWSENLENYKKSNYNRDELVPKFVKKNAYIRFQGQYIFSSNSDFETCFVNVLRDYIFRKYFKDYNEIYEFGCGTGHNLVDLCKIYPDKKFYGLDWAEAACQIVDKIAETEKIDLTSIQFDMFSPDESISLSSTSAVFTIGAMEQLGTNFEKFLHYIINKQVGICINIETMYELYNQDSLIDYLATKYLEKRGYLRGYLKKLRELESEEKIEIIDVKKTFGSFFHDGYNYIVWRPIVK